MQNKVIFISKNVQPDPIDEFFIKVRNLVKNYRDGHMEILDNLIMNIKKEELTACKKQKIIEYAHAGNDFNALGKVFHTANKKMDFIAETAQKISIEVIREFYDPAERSFKVDEQSLDSLLQVHLAAYLEIVRSAPFPQ
jgi:hypothetical protein